MVDLLDLWELGAEIWGTKESAEATEDYAEAQSAELRRVAAANAALSLYDAQVAEKDANAIRFQTAIALGVQLKEAQRLISKQRTGYGKSGVAVGAGTPLTVMAESAAAAARDTELIKYEGQTAVQRRRSLAARYRMLAKHGLRDAAAQAVLLEDAARYRSKAYWIKGAADLLGSLGDMGEEEGWWD